MAYFRYLGSLAIGLTMVCLASAFAPAPIYKATPKSKKADLMAMIQGEWEVGISTTVKGKGKTTTSRRTRIENNTWTYLTVINGVARPSTSYQLILDTSKEPARMTLQYRQLDRILMRGIVKIEGDTITFCYVTAAAAQRGEEPVNFTDVATPSGIRIMKMTLTRVR